MRVVQNEKGEKKEEKKANGSLHFTHAWNKGPVAKNSDKRKGAPPSALQVRGGKREGRGRIESSSSVREREGEKDILTARA